MKIRERGDYKMLSSTKEEAEKRWTQENGKERQEMGKWRATWA